MVFGEFNSYILITYSINVCLTLLNYLLIYVLIDFNELVTNVKLLYTLHYEILFDDHFVISASYYINILNVKLKCGT